MSSYDYVIVGAGSAGCVLANRLSEDAGVRVCLLEAGGRDSNPWIHVPAGYVKTMVMPGLNWMFDTEPDPQTANRPLPVPRGRVLGGTSSINGMVYVRGQAMDYDVWAQLGNRGWSYQDVLPYFRKSEHREGAGDPAFRGSGGELNVADVRDTDPLLDTVIETASGLGYPANPDYNGASQEGFGYFQTTMKRGRRMSTAKAFLRPAMGRRNLRVETGAHATAVSFHGRRAVGVRIRQRGVERTVRASREVILAAGAVQSPQLLELSGIGQADRLRQHGIEVVQDLPGVGENLQDHYIVRHSFRVRGARTLNERLSGVSFLGEVAKYALAGRGALTSPAGIVYGFVRTRAELATPDVQYHVVNASFRDPKKRILDSFPGLTIGPCQLRPHSRGSIHLRSADPFAAPVITPNFLHAEEDRATLLAGMRIARELASASPLARYVAAEETPGPGVDSDAALLDYAARTGATVYHPVGTCAMGSGEQAVVDDCLCVHGIDGLRVIDASVMPRLTSGNTNAPTIMIAEKGAESGQDPVLSRAVRSNGHRGAWEAPRRWCRLEHRVQLPESAVHPGTHPPPVDGAGLEPPQLLALLSACFQAWRVRAEASADAGGRGVRVRAAHGPVLHLQQVSDAGVGTQPGPHAASADAGVPAPGWILRTVSRDGGQEPGDAAAAEAADGYALPFASLTPMLLHLHAELDPQFMPTTPVVGARVAGGAVTSP